MKILQVSFENLNSLKGAHTIDLERGLLAESGIFSITGPTGAGKSTILDAVTLALYGKAARYLEERNPGEMMTRGTGECRAEVVFESPKGRFSAKWTVARARKKPEGRLQNARREIAEAASGKILAEKLREADDLIEQLTGLDYQRFLRSVLLAQGRFKEFLEASDNDRGDLLEKITGTEIYSRISKMAYAVQAERIAEIDIERRKLEGLALLTDEELEKFATEKLEKSTAILKTRERIEFLEVTLQKVNRLKEVQLGLQRIETNLEKWREKDESFGPARGKLRRHDATEPFQKSLIELESLERDAARAAEAVGLLEKNSAKKAATASNTLTAFILFLAGALQDIVNDLEKTGKARIQNLQQTGELKAWLADHARDQAIEAALPPIQRLGEQVRGQELQLKNEREQKKKLQVQLNAAKDNVPQARTERDQAAKNAKEAIRLRDEVRKRFDQAAKERSLPDWRGLQNRQISLVNKAEQLKVQQARWKQSRDELAGLEKTLPKLEQASEEAVNALELQQKICQEAEAVLNDKERIYLLSRQVASMDEHRLRLEKDVPCPLCGSTEHPYADHLDVDLDADKEAYTAQKLVVSKAQTLLTKKSGKYAEARTQVQNHGKALADKAKVLESEAQRFTETATELEYAHPVGDCDAFERWQATVVHEHNRLSEKIKSLESLEEGLGQADRACGNAEKNLSIATTKHENAVGKVDELTGQVAKQSDAIRDAEVLRNKRLQAFNEALGGLTETTAAGANETRGLTDALETRRKAYNQKIKQLEDSGHELKAIDTEIDRLKNEQQNRLGEAEEWTEKQKTFETTDNFGATQIEVPKKEKQRRAVGESVLQAAANAKNRLTDKITDRRNIDSRLEKARDTLSKRLEDSVFDSIPTLKTGRLPPEEREGLLNVQETLKIEKSELQGSQKTLHEELVNLQKLALPGAEETVELLKEKEIKTGEQDSLNQRLGEIRNILEEDEKARSGKAEQLRKIEQLEKEARPWSELNSLIGSASGDKFSKFAQGLTLAQLLTLANRHLLELNDRYLIQRNSDSELGLEIVDRYQADTVRPTRSLSGGESFLVSLALALGLSDLAGSDTRIESLFIDEGFGALDSETLDVALAALENLRLSNRTIGIISHVDALKQRISAQIQVSKTSDGFGSLLITSGS